METVCRDACSGHDVARVRGSRRGRGVKEGGGREEEGRGGGRKRGEGKGSEGGREQGHVGGEKIARLQGTCTFLNTVMC